MQIRRGHPRSRSETIIPEKAATWRQAGFNRISMGVQSFQDNELKAAGRMHRRDDVYRATQVLRDAGFQNVSFDLIAGLPHQTHDSWDESVAQLLSLRPDHVSIYLMEIDEGSRLGLEVLTGGTRYSASALPRMTRWRRFTTARARDWPLRATFTTKFRIGLCRDSNRGTI